MVESEFALTKSQNMINDIFGDDTSGFDVIINIETKTAVENLDGILKYEELRNWNYYWKY